MNLKTPKSPTVPKPQPIKTYPIHWIVIVQENDVYFAITAKDYENLSKTNADILRWVQEADWRLDFYKNEKDTN